MAKRKRSPIPPQIGVQSNLKPNAWDARLYQTSELAMNTIEQERAKIREKTARLRKQRLKAEQARMQKLSAAPMPEEIVRVLLRMKASRAERRANSLLRAQIVDRNPTKSTHTGIRMLASMNNASITALYPGVLRYGRG
jgi:hypothetical protein